MAGDPIRKLPHFHMLGMTVTKEYARLDNFKSRIFKDIDYDSVPSIPKATLN
jgi:hypothetical protein